MQKTTYFSGRNHILNHLMRKTIVTMLLLGCYACKPHPKPSYISFGTQHYVDAPFASDMSVPFVDSSLQAQFPWAPGAVENYFRHTTHPQLQQYYRDSTLYPTFTHLQTVNGTRFLVVAIIHDFEDAEKGEFADKVGHLFIDADNHTVYEYEPSTNSISLWQAK